MSKVQLAYNILSNEDNGNIIVEHDNNNCVTQLKRFYFEVEDNLIFYYFNGNYSVDVVDEGFRKVASRLLLENDIDFKITKGNAIRIK